MDRQNIRQLRDIPNVGVAIEKDFNALGISHPTELIGRDPYQLYDELCQKTGQRHDPCMIDVFLSAVRYMEGEPARKWWEYTAERKKHLGL